LDETTSIEFISGAEPVEFMARSTGKIKSRLKVLGIVILSLVGNYVSFFF
jgi:hypothetical protein